MPASPETSSTRTSLSLAEKAASDASSPAAAKNARTEWLSRRFFALRKQRKLPLFNPTAQLHHLISFDFDTSTIANKTDAQLLAFQFVPNVSKSLISQARELYFKGCLEHLEGDISPSPSFTSSNRSASSFFSIASSSSTDTNMSSFSLSSGTQLPPNTIAYLCVSLDVPEPTPITSRRSSSQISSYKPISIRRTPLRSVLIEEVIESQSGNDLLIRFAPLTLRQHVADSPFSIEPDHWEKAMRSRALWPGIVFGSDLCTSRSAFKLKNDLLPGISIWAGPSMEAILPADVEVQVRQDCQANGMLPEHFERFQQYKNQMAMIERWRNATSAAQTSSTAAVQLPTPKVISVTLDHTAAGFMDWMGHLCEDVLCASKAQANARTGAGVTKGMSSE